MKHIKKINEISRSKWEEKEQYDVDRYEELTKFVSQFGFIQYQPTIGDYGGIYCLKDNKHAGVDLKECELTEISIFREATKQLSSKCEDFYWESYDNRNRHI